MLVILFGLSGAGKNFVAKVLESEFHLFHWDADDLLTQDMLSCIQNHQPFTQDMRDHYYALVLKKIQTLRLEHARLVVTQAFYKDKNRKSILSEHSDALFVHITAEQAVLEQRLKKRNNQVHSDYARQISSNFEPATHDHAVLENNGDPEELLAQLGCIMGLAPIRKAP